MGLLEIFKSVNTASTLVFLSVVGALGILLGKVKVLNIKLGVAGVLFIGLLVGHFGACVDDQVLQFVKDFGLILFVYAVGIDIGPRFLSSLRNNGLKLNGLAFLIVVLGLLCSVGIKVLFNLDAATIAGLFTGAVTNTPSLGAAQSLINDQFANGAELADKAAMAYAIAYPFGIIGVILVMVLIKIIFRFNIEKEIQSYKDEQKAESGDIQTVQVKVTNPNIFGQTIQELAKNLKVEFVMSRLIKSNENEYIVPDAKIILEEGDIIIGLCKQAEIGTLKAFIGDVSLQPKFKMSENLTMRHILVTNKKIAGKTLKSINLTSMFPANITRIFRGETEIIPTGYTTLEFGDTIRVVGNTEKMDKVATFLGNSQRDLSHPNLIPLFIGIFLGILVGSIPIFIPGLPAPAKLGLAGGPLIIALILGHKGRVGKLDFYMTPSANRFIRELGIVLFLACVGLGSGGDFWETLVNGGYMWMLYAAIITFVPLFIVGIIGGLMKINYLTICGYLAGAMTDAPALGFVNDMAPVQAQATAYATVYPLTMFLRILCAQLLVLIFL
ncbi:MAG: putative transporter [Bacteroidales bacterium]|nr:putative transporter [Bacteroidales bacterium]MDD4671949.1 putative transporter [Bacteroidales bacterium]